jgi:hypothetical protein
MPQEYSDRMRTPVVAFVVLAALVVVAATPAADGQPKRALTKKDQAAALSIVIKRGDLGAGFTSRKRSGDDTLPKGARCDSLDESDLTVTGDAESPDFRFSRGAVFITIGSTAQVYRTTGEADTSWRRGSSAKTATCLADIVRLGAERGQKITVVSSKRVPFPSVAPRSTAFRLELRVSVNGSQAIPAYVDAIVMQHGRIQSGLLLTSIGRPVAQVDRLALASVVAARLEKAAGRRGPVA